MCCLFIDIDSSRTRKFVFLIQLRTIFLDILERASDCTWKIFAERTRMKLDEQLQENQQVNVHEDKSSIERILFFFFFF